ncbi:hypothetical protein F511_46793 [Dorcoceras hygrometricum]|uniref:Uncharacterized protein n=1 Tax=Dorcoceras hygrometricum TaxID=472368 RepID=A0A2Z6ZSM0_9LAMI|nr:hypothetical protein F511_46793 [Dorcoceras hygrometricum]
MRASRAHAAATSAAPSRTISSDVARPVVEIQAQHGTASHDQRPAIVGQQRRNNGRRCATTCARRRLAITRRAAVMLRNRCPSRRPSSVQQRPAYIVKRRPSMRGQRACTARVYARGGAPPCVAAPRRFQPKF